MCLRTSPGRNFKKCFVTRPPLALFSLCLILCVLVTVSLAIYVKYDGNIRNPDVLSFNTIGTNLNRIQFCVSPSEQLSELNYSRLSMLNRTSFRFPVEHAGKEYFHDAVYLAELSGSHLGFKSDSNITMTLSWSIEESHANVCITFHHVSTVTLPVVNRSLTCLSAAEETKLPKHVVMRVPKLFPPNVPAPCNETDSFSLNITGIKEGDVLLTLEDRAHIYTHLMVTSYFLLTSVFLIMCFAFLRGGSKPKPATGYPIDDCDREPLTS